MSERSFSPPANERAPSSEVRRDSEQAAALLEAAKVNFRLAMDTIPAIVWSALPDGSGDFFNKRWIEYTNLSPESLKRLWLVQGRSP